MSDEQIRSAIESVLADFNDPETGRSIQQMQQVSDLEVQADQVSLTLALTSWANPIREQVREDLQERIQAASADIRSIEINLASHDRAPQKLGEIGLTAKSVIAVGSGKGGVGKSTIAAALALGLKRAGCRVGLMDADVYGPSVPHLLGVNERPAVVENRIEPIQHQGLAVMSMGFLVPAGEAVVWRGPMLHGAITQFLRDTNWGPLDYLIIDMPPGTGDIALTLSQMLPLSGAVVVCTPQDVALLDATKAIAMFGKVNIPVLGMVENMSGFVCPDCEKRHDIFGSGGARSRAEELQVPFLGEVPINIAIRTNGDAGASDATYEDPIVAAYLNRICHSTVTRLAGQAKAKPPGASLPVIG